MLVNKLRQRGDTIVEVMIVLAVLGSAIGISYATANRSLVNARQAQENAEAAKLAQTQVEALELPSKITNSGDANYLYVTNKTFCMADDGAGSFKVVPFTSATANSKTQRNLDYDSSPGDYPTECTASNGLYHYSIRYSLKDASLPGGNGIATDASANDSFTIVVVWDDAQGQGKDTVTLTYRVHQQLIRNDIF